MIVLHNNLNSHITVQLYIIKIPRWVYTVWTCFIFQDTYPVSVCVYKAPWVLTTTFVVGKNIIYGNEYY